MKKTRNVKSIQNEPKDKHNTRAKKSSKTNGKNSLKQYVYNQIEKIKNSKLFKTLLKNAWYINIPLVITSFLLVYNKIVPINGLATVTYYTIYYILFEVSICSIYMIKNERLRKSVVLVGILSHMLHIFNFALFIPCISYMVLFSKRLKWLKILLVFIPVIISIITFSIDVSVHNYTEKIEIKKVISPNEKYIARHVTYDAGALGGNEIVMLERRYRWVMMKKEKQIYIDSYGRHINIGFKDNKHLILNGKEIDVRM